MLAFIYTITLWSVGSTLILTINGFEPDRQLASALEFLVGALGAAAVAHRLMS